MLSFLSRRCWRVIAGGRGCRGRELLVWGEDIRGGFAQSPAQNVPVCQQPHSPCTALPQPLGTDFSRPPAHTGILIPSAHSVPPRSTYTSPVSSSVVLLTTQLCPRPPVPSAPLHCTPASAPQQLSYPACALEACFWSAHGLTTRETSDLLYHPAWLATPSATRSEPRPSLSFACSNSALGYHSEFSFILQLLFHHSLAILCIKLPLLKSLYGFYLLIGYRPSQLESYPRRAPHRSHNRE